MLVCKDTALLKSLLLDVTDVSCYNLSVTLHGLSVITYNGCQLHRLSVTQTVFQLHQLHLEQPRDSKGENKLSHVPALLAF